MGCVRDPSHCHGSPLHQVAEWELGSTSGVPKNLHSVDVREEKQQRKMDGKEILQMTYIKKDVKRHTSKKT